MKLKYYLRGLGIGIFVTAIIMGISAGKRQPTDEEIKARARELGMIESTVLSNMPDLSQPDSSTAGPKESIPEESTPEETIPEESKPAEAEPAEPDESTPAEEDEEESEPPASLPAEEPAGQLVTITIRSGQSSVSVSKQLAEAGLVESASEYDKYLCANGYDKKIRVGTYEIAVGASEEEIARTITGG